MSFAGLRRWTLIGIVVAVCVLLGILAIRKSRTSGAHAASGPPPLVVLVSIDTLRADRLAPYGSTSVPTPAFAALARDGVVFERAYTHAPQTLPAHASLLTGRLPFEHGVRDNMGFTLPMTVPSVTMRLHDQGYTTGAFVSAYVLRHETGIAQGFDRFDDTLPSASTEIAVGDVQRPGIDTVAAALGWLNSVKTPRAFLFLHLYEPHSPYTPPAEFAHLPPYDGDVAYADRVLGQFLDGLRTAGRYDDALIVVLSDHGESLGEHGEAEHGLFLYNSTMQVPFVIKFPAQRHAGTRVTAPVQLIDVAPTLLELCGAQPFEGVRGRSLMPVANGGALAPTGIYAEAMYPRYHFGWSELYSLTDDRFRFVRAPRDELYDLQQDPGDRRDVSTERAQTRAAMRQALDTLKAGATVGAPQAVSAEARERLKALGYVGSADIVNGADGSALPDPKDKVHVLEAFRRGLDLVRRGRAAEAITLFQQLTRENPSLADAWAELAGLLVRSQRFDEAAEAYRNLVRAAPHDPAAIVNVAQVELLRPDYEKAIAEARLALSVLPASDVQFRQAARLVIARAALGRGDRATATAEADAARRDMPDSFVPSFVDGLIAHSTSRFEDAARHFAMVLEATRTRAIQQEDVRYYLGDSLARLERIGEAEPLLREQIRLYPHDLRARASLAMLYRASGRIAESDAAIAAILRVSPTPAGSALAEKLWTMFGDTKRAAAVRTARGRETSR